jgi:ABC-type dipeptide/oligopeptide/nickel transport system permease subunit
MLKKTQALSPGKIALRRFMKDTWAMGGLLFIILCLLITLLGYTLTPDKTPHADLQCLEVALTPPLTRVSYIRLEKKNHIRTGFFKKLLFGAPSKYVDIPVKNYILAGDTLRAEKYMNYLKGTTDQQIYITSELGLKPQNHTKIFMLGTDRFGRDVLSRLMIGTRITMMVGFIAVIISLVLGILLGSLAGYFRGWVDRLISWIMNITWSIPTLLLVLTITISLGKGLLPVFVAVGLTMWVDVARIVRGEIFAVREKEFVMAAKALGYRSTRIIFRHILPNVVASVLVIASANFASAILIESGLSFLGLGAQPPTPTWGNMIESHRNFIITPHAHLALIPGFAIMLLVLAFTMVSNGLKNAIEKR